MGGGLAVWPFGQWLLYVRVSILPSTYGLYTQNDDRAEPLMGTDGEREEGESDVEHLRGYGHSRHHLEIGCVVVTCMFF